jgi:lipoyl(octanoyl) transferase
LGLTDYKDTLAFQHQLFKKRHMDEIVDTLILGEHYPVYTCGRASNANSLIKDKLPKGVELIKVDRGGSLTFHGPGQLIIYPIINLDKNMGVMHYLRQLE